MNDPVSRRDWLKTVGAAGAVGMVPTQAAGAAIDGDSSRAPTGVLPLTSTSEVFIPPRGRAFQKFSFDFPEPSVAFAGLRFGFLVFTRENAYGLDRDKMTVEQMTDGVRVTAAGLVWAGDQQHRDGRVVAELRQTGGFVEWEVAAEMDIPIKAITTVVRGVPRGKISTGGHAFDPHDNELLFGYPFGAGDLWGGNTAASILTPFIAVEPEDGGCFFLSSLDDRVRAKRFYFEPGPQGYRVEAVFEGEGWLDQKRLKTPTWRAGHTATLDDAVQRHYDHLAEAYAIPAWNTRADVPAWLRDTALVVSLHGMHYTGYVFNDYARMLEILKWVATRIPPQRVLVFLASWDGRYYWDYPLYRPADRLGGEDGFRRLIQESQRLGFRMMPMFGANAANRQQAVYGGFSDARTILMDEQEMNITWVDWDNDRHQEGWLAYMNLGVESWRDWLTGRIAETIDRYGVDAYFLDIVAGWMNNRQADMHEGTRRLVADLRSRYPHVLACGEFSYDALWAFIPLYHVYVPRAVPFARFFSHLSHPAPGRGSSGVHESGFNHWDPKTLSLAHLDGLIPTVTVVDDTFTAYRDQFAGIIDKAKEWAGI